MIESATESRKKVYLPSANPESLYRKKRRPKHQVLLGKLRLSLSLSLSLRRPSVPLAEPRCGVTAISEGHSGVVEPERPTDVHSNRVQKCRTIILSDVT